jgi:opacity protein-like surface antigen
VTGSCTEASVEAESTLGSNYHDLYHHTSESSWEDGWFVGGGIEALVTDNISLKAEYRCNDYGGVKNNKDDGADTDNQEADITVHSVRAVLSYRFGL